VAESRPELKALLQRPGAVFLDVGVGSAWLAIQACRVWPQVSVIGFDIWQPALDIAARNVEEQRLSDRIELRLQDVTETKKSDEGMATVAWLPTMFIPESRLQAALLSLRAALQPDGWLVVGRYMVPSDDFGVAMTSLRTITSGGRWWSDQELEAELRKAGYGEVSHVVYNITQLTIVRRSPATPAEVQQQPAV